MLEKHLGLRDCNGPTYKNLQGSGSEEFGFIKGVER
jgi:hypothetical protein